MGAFSKNVVPKDKVCDTCGDVGYAENMVTCYRCNTNSEHGYCMQNPVVGVPKYWICEECAPRSNGKSEKRKTILLDTIEARKAATPIKRCRPFLTSDSKQFNGVRQEPPSVRQSSLKISDASTSKGKGKEPISCPPSSGVLSTPTIPRNIRHTTVSQATCGMPVSPTSGAPVAHSRRTNRASEPSAAQCILTTQTKNIGSETPNAHCRETNRAKEPCGILTIQSENAESRTAVAHSRGSNRASEPSAAQYVLTTQTKNIGSEAPNAHCRETDRAKEPSGILTTQTENAKSRTTATHSRGTNRASEPSAAQCVLTTQTKNIGSEAPNAHYRETNRAKKPSGILTTQTENVELRTAASYSRGTNRASESSAPQCVLTTKTKNIGSEAPSAHCRETNRAKELSGILTTQTENVESRTAAVHSRGTNRVSESSVRQGVLTTQTENIMSRAPNDQSLGTNRTREPSGVLTIQIENIRSRAPNTQSQGTNRANELSVRQGVLTIQTENIGPSSQHNERAENGSSIHILVGQGVLTIQTENIGPSSQHNEIAENRSSICFVGNTARVDTQIEVNGYQNANPEPNAHCRGINRASQPCVEHVLTTQTENIGSKTPNTHSRVTNRSSEPFVEGVLTTQTENIGTRAFNAHPRETNRASEPSILCVTVRHGVLTIQTVNIGPSSQHDHSAVRFQGITAHAGAQIERDGYQNTHPEPKLLLISEGMPPHHPVPNACWTLDQDLRQLGDFKIFDSTSDGCREIQGIRAHIPTIVSPKVYENMKRMHGRSIQLKLLQRLDVWPTLFDLEPPRLDDIGLFFFPSKEQRSKEKFTHLVNMMDKQGLAMKGRLPDAKLLIFTYSQLPLDHDGTEREVYLWGVLRRVSPKAQSAPGQEKLLVNSPISGNCKPNGDKNHATGSSSGSRSEGIANARTNVPHAPPGFSEPNADKNHATGSSSGSRSEEGIANAGTNGVLCRVSPKAQSVPGQEKPVFNSPISGHGKTSGDKNHATRSSLGQEKLVVNSPLSGNGKTNGDRKLATGSSLGSRSEGIANARTNVPHAPPGFSEPNGDKNNVIGRSSGSRSEGIANARTNGVLYRLSPEAQSAPGQEKLVVNSPLPGNGKTNGDKNHATGSSLGSRSEGIANARTNVPHGPPGFLEPIYRNQVKRERQSMTHSPVLVSRDDVDSPPGFSKPIYRPKRS